MQAKISSGGATLLRRAGFRVTAQRVKVLQLLKQETIDQKHFSVGEIYKLLRTAGDTFSVATIYRILGEFETCGLVSRVQFNDGRTLFELAEGARHDHMLRIDTQEILEFTDAELTRRARQLAAERGLELIDQRLVLFVRPKADGGQSSN